MAGFYRCDCSRNARNFGVMRVKSLPFYPHDSTKSPNDLTTEDTEDTEKTRVIRAL